MRRLICRADGNAATGLGHLYRMFALYEMYKDTFGVTFITREDSEIKVIPKDYKTRLIPTSLRLQDEAEWLSHHFNAHEDIILIDGYHFVGDYQKQLNNLGFYIMYVDDLVTKKLHANIVVNHSENLHRSQFNSSQDSIFALGTKYAILRPQFLEAAKQGRKVNTIDTAFVCFGGADALDLTSKAVEALLQCNPVKKIHIILGGAYKHNSIFKLAENNSVIKIHQNLDETNLIKVMSACNFAIVPSSTILYEICCVKMPVLSGYFVDNQKNIYAAFDEEELIYPAEDFSKYNVEDFKNRIEAILNKTDYNYFIANQSKLFDGKIKQRFLNLLKPLEFRKATLEDSRLLFDWSNDDLVRQNSFNSEQLIFENHNQWFAEKLKDESQLFLIAMVDNQEAGLVRYSIEENNAVVGISISKPFRGKQLAPRFLIDSAKQYFKTNALPIFAYIKKENIASIKSFKNAGYVYLKDTEVKGYDSKIYQLEKKESHD